MLLMVFFLNYSGIVISDDNFNVYFDEKGCFKFEDINSIVLVITKLSNKDMLINQKNDFIKWRFS